MSINQPAPKRDHNQPAPKRDLLDIGFSRFLSLSLIKIWWVVALVIIALFTVISIITGCYFMTQTAEEGGGVAKGIGTVIAAPIIGLVFAVLTRLFLEGVAVLFRIADNTSKIAIRTNQGGDVGGWAR